MSTSRPKKDSNFAFGHSNGDTQLLNLGTVSFAHGVSLQTKITFLLEYWFYAINRTMSLRRNGFDTGILCENAVKAFYRYTNSQWIF